MVDINTGDQARPRYLVDPNTGLPVSAAADGVAQGSSTSGQTGVLSQGAVTTAAPTYVTGQTNPLSLTTGGDLRTVTHGVDATNVAPSVNPMYISGLVSSGVPAYTTGRVAPPTLTLAGELITATGGIGTNATDSLGVGINLLVARDGTARISGAAQFRWNGTGYDRAAKANLFKRVASSAAAGNPDFLKASGGTVIQFWGVCGATAAFLQLYNKTSAPTIGTDTPVLTFPIPANGNFSQIMANEGAYFTVGVAFAFTTDAAGTTGSAAAAITSFALLGA